MSMTRLRGLAFTAALTLMVMRGETCRSISPSSGITFDCAGIILDAGRWILLIEYRESSIQFSPSQFLNHLVRVCQIVEQKIWSVPLQSFTRPTASRHRNGARAKCFSAG